jgi:hypothetical protein
VSGFELSALEPVFRAIKLADLDVVLLGGHAVSFYAVKYSDRCPELLRYYPLLSKDADLLGTVDDRLRLASALRLEWRRNPRKGGMQGLSLGQINLPEPPGAKLEILGKILGADAESIRESALNESSGDIRIRVIHPLLLYQTKGINLAGIDQQRGKSQRQDAKQFVIMGIVVAELLKEFATTSGDERALVKSAGRLLEFALTEDGAALVKTGAMDPTKLLPLSRMKAHADGSVRNVVDKRLPHFQSQLSLALERVPAEQAEKIRADLERMESELATPSSGGEFSQEVERERRKRQSFSDHSMRLENKKQGPNR